MTTRHSGYLVILQEDMREDDAEAMLTALRMIRFVAGVRPVEADVAVELIERARRDRLWQDALMRLAREGPD